MRKLLLVLCLLIPVQVWADCTLLTADGNAVDSSSYNTASITPTANTLVLVAVGSTIAADPPTTPTITGNSLTYVQIATSFQQGDAGTDYYRNTLFRALGAGPTSGAITIDFSSVTQLGAQWSVSECSGTDTSGTNGSGAIVQSVTRGSGDCVDTAACTATLAAFGSASNWAYGAFYNNKNNALTEGTGFTELSDAGGINPARRLGAEWKLNETAVTMTSASATADHAVVAIEIKAALVASGDGVIGSGVCRGGVC